MKNYREIAEYRNKGLPAEMKLDVALEGAIFLLIGREDKRRKG